MAKQCRSVSRALRRGHPLHQGSNTYMSKKESRILKEIYQAALRKQQAEEEKVKKQAEETQKKTAQSARLNRLDEWIEYTR